MNTRTEEVEGPCDTVDDHSGWPPAPLGATRPVSPHPLLPKRGGVLAKETHPSCRGKPRYFSGRSRSRGPNVHTH